ncbi:pyridoxamine 5'-phosphate oxidase family protein [Plantactinospora siamensis]|uniref:Pyridoxamine 5'-phosphate oxidase family protein n=1 Tax=Plantactinospora siamensis TaxID=555372 RepID=A0ABV6P6G5_9ACTN
MTSSDARAAAQADGPAELDRAECLRLLAAGVVGRVVFTERAMPAVHPVTYVLDGEEVVFRTVSGGKLAAARRHAVLAFEIDQIDPAGGTGWSVLGIGPAYEVLDTRRLAELAFRLPATGAASARDGRMIAVPLQHLTGRRLSVDPSAPAR